VEDKIKPERTLWHRLLGKLFELLLTPLGIIVYVDFNLMSAPPRADILLLRRKSSHWTKEQMAYLPDGIRDSSASHILLELKYTESLTAEAIEKTHGYDIFYRDNQNLSEKKVETFILSAKTPNALLLKRYGYEETEWPGLYRSSYPMVERVAILVLNKLRPETHNAYIKLFASREEEKQKAFDLLAKIKKLPSWLWLYMSGLKQVMFPWKGEEEMTVEITADYVMKIGAQMRESLLANLSVEERLRGLKPEDRMKVGASLSMDERLRGLKPEEVLSRYKPEEVLSRYKPEEVLSRYKPYLAEQQQQTERRTIVRTLRRTLQMRFHPAEELLQRIEHQLQQFGVTTLDQLDEVAVMVDRLSGFEEKLKEVILKMLGDTLTSRFEIDSDKYVAQMTDLNWERLGQLHEVAKTVSNLTEFEMIASPHPTAP